MKFNQDIGDLVPTSEATWIVAASQDGKTRQEEEEEVKKRIKKEGWEVFNSVLVNTKMFLFRILLRDTKAKR